jgi:hypothetical protein
MSTDILTTRPHDAGLARTPEKGAAFDLDAHDTRQRQART